MAGSDEMRIRVLVRHADGRDPFGDLDRDGSIKLKHFILNK
jgi:hypothetical protein